MSLPNFARSRPWSLIRLLVGALLISKTVCPSAIGMDNFMEENFVLTNWDIEDGLPNSRVTAITQTPDGFLWIGTSSGLARFDGTRFVTFDFSNTPAFKNDFITCLLADKQGALWVGTASGQLLKRGRNDFAVIHSTSSNAAINSLAQDREGSIWVATQGEGLIRLQGAEKKVFGGKEGLSGSIWRVSCDPSGRLWVEDSGKLLTFEHGQWRMPEFSAPWLSKINMIGDSRDAGLWVASLWEGEARIFQVKDLSSQREIEPYSSVSQSQRSRAQALLEDHSRRLWVGTYGRGVFFRTLTGPWQRLSATTSLNQAIVESLFEDADGSVWVGSRTNGIFRVRNRPVTALSPPPAEQDPAYFLTAGVTRDGSIWGGTDGDGAFRWQNGVLKRYGAAEGLENQHVEVLLEDQQSRLFAGTAGGLFQFDGEKFHPMPGPPALGAIVLALFEDRRGNLWVGTSAGLIRFDGREYALFTEKEGLDTSFIRAITEDREGRIWVAVTGAGLFRQNGDKFERVGHGLWTGEKSIRALFADSDGVLWIATYGAWLTRFKDGQFTQLKGTDGVPDSHIHSVIEDQQRWLWFSSDNGIFGGSRTALKDYESSTQPPLKFVKLSRSEGLPSKRGSSAGQPTAALSPDGRLVFPDGNALAIFRPDDLPRRSFSNPPSIDEVIADGKVGKPGLDGRLRLKSGVQRLELHYTSPAVTAPEKLQFRIKMQGLDHQWVDMGSSRETSYNRVPPGQYVFRVAARTASSSWTESLDNLVIEIVPRWWERSAVRIAGVVLAGVFVGFIVWRWERARTRRQLERLKFQQTVNNERQRIARDIHDDLGTGLTQIMLAGRHLERDATLSSPGQKWARDIADSARALTRSMDEVVWAINPRNDTIDGLLTYLNKSAQESLSTAGIRCRWDLPDQIPPLHLAAEARHHLYLACKEAIHNIIKHANASEARIRLILNPNGFLLEIEDNGKGFHPGEFRERGHGLKNMRDRLKDLGGQCDIESSPGGGTRVRLTITPKKHLPNSSQ